ncbi:MAG: hypothetical protein Q7J07_01230 [Pelolinea sp.]|nr:hypothetical protein [Pelolinea sp.]
MIADALNFFFLFPLFWIILYLSRNPRFWKTATQTFLMVGVIICLLGIIEFFVPAFRTQTLGLIQTETKGLNSFYGITRASFSFYGTPAAVVISSLCLPMASLIPKFYKGFWGKALAIICVVILGVGIYISGIRAAWLMIVVTSILLAYFKIGILGVGLTGGFWYIVSRFLPSEAWSLILTLANPLSTGKILDTSLQKRVWRQQYAFRLIQKYPLGVGWSGSGWVHGDFTQVTANLGILAGILFLAWYLHTLYRGWKYNRKSPKDWLFKAIFTSFILCGIVLAVEGVQVLTQFIMPVWFVWGLMEAYMQQKKTVNILSTGDK